MGQIIIDSSKYTFLAIVLALDGLKPCFWPAKTIQLAFKKAAIGFSMARVRIVEGVQQGCSQGLDHR